MNTLPPASVLKNRAIKPCLETIFASINAAFGSAVVHKRLPSCLEFRSRRCTAVPGNKPLLHLPCYALSSDAYVLLKAFNGKWGDVYLGSIYHHGNGSFAGGDERLKWQLTLENKSFRDLVIYWRKYREPSKYGIIFRLLRRYRRYKLSQSKIREIGTKVVLPPYNGPVALKEQLIDSCNSSNGPSAPI